MRCWHPKPLGYYFRYDSARKRLHIHGSHSLSNLDSIASMIRQRMIASDLDAVIYRDVDCIRIIRGRVLELLIESASSFSWPGSSSK
jgi:hypothetical protein